MINIFVYYIILSIVIISLIHYLYSYFINILTVPKIKDLVNKPGQEYKNIEKIILNKDMKNNIISDFGTTNNNIHSNNIDNGNDNDTTNISNLQVVTTESKNDMKKELKNFFNDLNINNNSNNIGNHNGNNLSYSNY